MTRRSAKHIAKMIENYTTQDVYDVWKDMGLIIEKAGDWVLTDLGKEFGGKYSKAYGVPIFEDKFIVDKMVEFTEKLFSQK